MSKVKAATVPVSVSFTNSLYTESVKIARQVNLILFKLSIKIVKGSNLFFLSSLWQIYKEILHELIT